MLIPPDQDIDPPAFYASIDDEMIASAPILVLEYHNPIRTRPFQVTKLKDEGTFHPYFLQDMTHVWDVLFQVFGKQSCWTHVKPTQKTKNGQMAY